jgi:putative ABC transport system substrate-binding protein
VTAADPVATGFVASLNHPGGNLTGVALLSVELAPKKLQLLHELVPTARTFALLVNPANRNTEMQSREMQAAANGLGLQLHILRASSEGDLDGAFGDLIKLQVGALAIGTDGFFNSRSEQLATLSLRHAIPAVFQYREFTAAGGLMSYGTSLTDAYRQVGVYVGRILKARGQQTFRCSRRRRLI